MAASEVEVNQAAAKALRCISMSIDGCHLLSETENAMLKMAKYLNQHLGGQEYFKCGQRAFSLNSILQAACHVCEAIPEDHEWIAAGVPGALCAFIMQPKLITGDDFKSEFQVQIVLQTVLKLMWLLGRQNEARRVMLQNCVIPDLTERLKTIF